MSQLVLIAGAAALGGLVLGALISAILVGKRMRRRMEEVGGEVARLHGVAQDKLSGDDPDLKTLLRDLNAAVEKTYRAVDALEDQAELTRRKSEGGKEVIASSRYIINMIEDFGAEVPQIAMPVREAKPAVEATEKITPSLR